MEFADQAVEWVPTTYPRLPRLLPEQCVDAVVWTTDEMAPHRVPNVLHRPLSPAVREAIAGTDTSAVLITSSENRVVSLVAQELFQSSSLVAVQQGVIAGHVTPEY